MAEELQNLLDKIHNEGIKKAEAERDAMLADARKQAEELVRKAREEADAVRKQAELDREALEKRAESAIRQAARDIILALKEELKRRLAEIRQSPVYSLPVRGSRRLTKSRITVSILSRARDLISSIICLSIG